MVNEIRVPRQLDSVVAAFDDERLIANAGVLLPVTLMQRLGVEELVEECVDLGDRPGAARPGRKVCSLAAAMALGADSIDDCDVLRSGASERLLGHKAMAPSTLGTFLRSFSFGHVRQLDRVLEGSIKRAWEAGAGPGAGRLVIDIDSFIGPVHGYEKAGRRPRLHRRARLPPADRQPLEALRGPAPAPAQGLGRIAARGAALRSRSCSPGSAAAGASGEILIRADTAFWNNKVCAYLERKRCRYSIGVPMHKIVVAAIARIPEQAWQPVADYPESGVCELAETTLGERRLIVRRVHLHAQESQAELFTYWRHFAFITNRDEEMHLVDSEHRQHAEVELVIRDLKDQALAHFPSASFAANSAWALIGCARPQPRLLDQPARVDGLGPAPGCHPASPPVRDPRAVDSQRPAMDASSAGALALAAGVHRGARADQGIARARLSALPVRSMPPPGSALASACPSPLPGARSQSLHRPAEDQRRSVGADRGLDRRSCPSTREFGGSSVS